MAKHVGNQSKNFFTLKGPNFEISDLTIKYYGIIEERKHTEYRAYFETA